MIKRFDVYVNVHSIGVMKAAELALLEEQQQLRQVGFRYSREYLSHSDAFSLDPEQLPLQEQEFNLFCRGAAPAVLDDYLPDAWGKKVLSKIALLQKKRLNSHCVSELLLFLQQAHSRIGALAIVKSGEKPIFSNGIELSQLEEAELSAQKIDRSALDDIDANALGLICLANSGSGVGGARPKALVQDKGQYYLAKFNRHNDPYNNARVELACLNMARAAGVLMGEGKIVSTISQREVLMLERFDIYKGGRRHVITANGLLKQAETQQDPGYSFRYNDLYALLQKHSYDIEADLKQLLRLMFFNRAINNTDDHERNFSFIHDGKGYRLSPAYDLVPSISLGGYHAAGFNYQAFPPRASEAEKLGSVFGLSKECVKAIAHQVVEAISCWPEFATQVGVEPEEIKLIAKYFAP